MDRSLLIRPYQNLILDKRAILKFTNNKLTSCINMSMSAEIEGGLIEVDEKFKNTVISYDTAINESLVSDTYPFTFNANDVQTRYGLMIRDITIQKNRVRPRDITCVGGIAIKFLSRGNSYNIIWGSFLKNIKINGGFDRGISIESQNDTWIHDTFITNVIMQYTKLPFYLDKVGSIHISDGAFQPMRSIDGYRYTEHGVVMNSCSNIEIDNYQFWDFQEAKEGNTFKVFMLNGLCKNIKIDDFASLQIDGNRRVQFDTFETLLTLKYWTPHGEFLFPEIINFRDYKEQKGELREKVVSDISNKAFFDYNIPIYSAENLIGASQSNPIYLQLGYVKLALNESDEVYTLTIEDRSNEGIIGYSNIKIGTDSKGKPSLTRKTQILCNTNLSLLCDYAYTYTKKDGITKVVIYKKYTGIGQDVHHFTRSIRITSSHKFITKAKSNASPNNPKVIPHLLGNPYEYNVKPSNAPVGYSYFCKKIGKPIWCKTATVFDKNGSIVTPAVWVDSTGTIV